MSVRPAHRALGVSALASMLAHASAFAIATCDPAPSEAPGQEGPAMTMVDVHEPPAPPEAHAPDPVPVTLREPPAPAPAPEPPPEPEAADYGLGADGGAADAGPRPADAGLAAAGDAATGDAGPRADGGLLAARRDGGARSPGRVARTGDAGAGSAAALAVGAGDAGAGAAPAGANADLRAFAPEGDRVTVLLRLDRVRETPWEERVRAILAPMPDYRSIVGGRDVALSDHFDWILISSPDPSDVTATTLAASTRENAGSLRAFLDRERAPVAWEPVRGGALGTRGAGPARAAGDPRVFLIPRGHEHTVLLARREHLGALARTGRAPAPSEPPGWIERVREVGDAAGDGPDGPMAVVSAHGLPDAVALPRLGDVPAPRHAALALEIAERGFRVRGTLTFATGARAARFEQIATGALRSLVDSYAGALILKRMHAYNAARGLSIERVGRRVGYATSISIADGRAALEFAAVRTARYFGVAPPFDAGP